MFGWRSAAGLFYSRMLYLTLRMLCSVVVVIVAEFM